MIRKVYKKDHQIVVDPPLNDHLMYTNATHSRFAFDGDNCSIKHLITGEYIFNDSVENFGNIDGYPVGDKDAVEDYLLNLIGDGSDTSSGQPTYTAPSFKAASPIRSATINQGYALIPAGLLVGDLILKVSASASNPAQTGATMTEGFTVITTAFADGLSYAVGYKIATASDSANDSIYTYWNEAPDPASRVWDIIYTYSGAGEIEGIDANTAVSNTGQQFTNSNSSSINNALAVAIYFQEDNTLVTNNSTGYVEDDFVADVGGSDFTIATGSQEILIGESGGTQYYQAGASDNNVNVGFFIKPAKQ